MAESLPVTQAIKALGSEQEYVNCKMLSLEKKAQGLNLGNKHSKGKKEGKCSLVCNTGTQTANQESEDILPRP